MPTSSGRVGGPQAGARIVLLARTAAALPTQPPWDPASPWWPTEAWCGDLGTAGGEGKDQGYPTSVVRARPAPSLRSALRARLSLARTLVRATRAGVDWGWVRTLHDSHDLRRAVRSADVLWSLDADTDAALAVLPGLTTGRQVLTSGVWAGTHQALAALDGLLSQMAGGSSRSPQATVDRWLGAVRRLEPSRLPAALRVLDAVTEASRRHQLHRGLLPGAEATVALDAVPWPPGPRAVSGLGARRAAADLSLGLLAWDDVDETVLAEIAGAAVGGADAALDDGDEPLALARLGDAMSLLFNRSRHAEVPSSPLVAAPAAYLDSLHRSRTLATLVGPGAVHPDAPSDAEQRQTELAGPAVGGTVHGAQTGPDPGTPGEPPRVLVVTGAYGSFHAGVVAALRGHAEIKIRDFTRKHPALGRKAMDPWVLPAVAALRATARPVTPSWVDKELRAEVRTISAQVRPMLRWANVVFADWADRATVWVSHLCPADVRLVVRVHALDALDPWLHLVRWERVDSVVVVSEPMRSLVVDLLAGLGVRVPVHVVRHSVPALPDLARGKEPSARTTLGMIGWGRRVKDPLWAFDLLERDPSWELVLIGPDFHADPGPVAAPYAEAVHARLASASLRDRVHVIGPTRDVSEPLRRVGVILSTSVRESWHLGLVEGAASGAVPVVRDWPLLAARGGPRTLFPDEWVVDDVDQAEARVRHVTDPAVWPEASARSRAQAMALFAPDEVAADYREVVLHGRPPRGG